MPQPLRHRIGACALIGASAACLGAGLAWAGGWIGPHRTNGGDVVSALEYNAGGAHPGYRRAHAKGLCFTGRFEADGAGAALSTATALSTGVYPVVGRFSTAGGDPFAADGRNVFHAMALSIRTPDGQDWRMAMDHTPIFPVADVASFVALQRASRPDPATGKPDPASMKAYLAGHPETAAFQAFMAKAALPDSFAGASYYSINAFRLTNAHGETQAVRWRMAPEAPTRGFDKAKLADLPRDALIDEMIERTARAPSHWRLEITLANPGDRTDNATVAWRGPHRRFNVGELVIDQVQTEEAGGCRDLNFDPTILPRGVSPSDDPLLGARAKAYSTSFTARAGESPGPSAAARRRMESAL